MSVSVSEYLYPELMTIDRLVNTLKQRFVKVDNLESLEKHELVDLYNKYILPLPQRKYRLNRRGREMTKKQIIASKKRKAETASDSATDEVIPQNRQASGKLLTSFEAPAVQERLKPPPSCVDFQKKTIKLGSKPSKTVLDSVSVSPVSASINKLELSNKSSGGSPTKKLRLTDSSTSETELQKNKTIRLINSHLQTSKSDKGTKVKEVEKSAQQHTHEGKTETLACPMDTADSSKLVPEVKERKKIKIARIAWP